MIESLIIHNHVVVTLIEIVLGIILFIAGAGFTTMVLKRISMHEDVVAGRYKLKYGEGRERIIAPSLTSLENLVFTMGCMEESIKNTITKEEIKQV